jgi:hypothetical protein
LSLLVFYCVPREGEIIDGLIELLLEITHRITVRAERRVVEELFDEYRQVPGKTGLLFRVASEDGGRYRGELRASDRRHRAAAWALRDCYSA